MAIITTLRPNLGSSGLIELFDDIEFEGFDDDDFHIEGDDLDNIIEGGIGHDDIDGDDGNDILTGGDGNDTLEGDSGNDILDGQGGNDRLFGDDDDDDDDDDGGDDILLAGSGNDIMTGGSGNDIFGFYGAGHFEITDFSLADDRLFFDSAALGIDSLEQLVSFITNVEQDDKGVRVEFDDDASVTLVGVNLDDVTDDMIIFIL